LDLGCDNVFEWYWLQDTGVDSSSKENGAEFRLAVQTQAGDILDLVFRKLHYDASQPESEFSHDCLAKMVKKKDKELGP